MLKKCEKKIIVIEMNLFFLYIMMISMFKSEMFNHKESAYGFKAVHSRTYI